MAVFDSPAFSDHEQVVFCKDSATGLRAIIAVHNTNLGPALGGCRMWSYESDEDALTDVLRLSRGMTYKNALAGLPLGGGKSVIIGDPRRDKTPALFESFGRFVDSLGGRYIAAEDVGTSVEDMDAAARFTASVRGGSAGTGNPSPATAYGVYMGIRAAVAFRLKRNNLGGLKVAVQGLGNVGTHLCRHLHEDGAELYVADVNGAAVDSAVGAFDATAVTAGEIHGLDVDVFAPCALGAVIDDRTVQELRVAIVAGAANNQLAEDRHGDALHRRGILYAPDYVLNAGGVIHIAHEGPDFDHDTVYRKIAGIYDTLTEIFRRSEAEDLPTHVIAGRFAEQRFTVH